MVQKQEIFNEYIKIAEEQGLLDESDFKGIKTASDEISVIEALYGVKPNGEKKNLVDEAHPDPVVVLPSHDAFNGAVGNNHVNQNVSIFLALKTPDGAISYQRYVRAYDDLMKSLVRVGFTMDNDNEEDLMKYADDCATRLTKQGIAPMFFLLGAGLFLGYTALVNNILDPVSDGIIHDVDNSIIELKEAQEDAYPGVKNEIENIIKSLQEFRYFAIQAMSQGPIPVDLTAPTASTVAELNNDDTSKQKMRVARDYLNAIRKLKSIIPNYIGLLQSAAETDSTFSSNWGSYLAPIKKVYRFFDPDDLTDAYKQLRTLEATLKSEEARLTSVTQAGNSIGQKLLEDLKSSADENGESITDFVNKQLSIM